MYMYMFYYTPARAIVHLLIQRRPKGEVHQDRILYEQRWYIQQIYSVEAIRLTNQPNEAWSYSIPFINRTFGT